MKYYYGLWTHNLARNNSLVKIILMMDLFLKNSFSIHKMFIDGPEWCGLLVNYYNVLSAFLTLILTAPIHCRGSIGEQVL